MQDDIFLPNFEEVQKEATSIEITVPNQEELIRRCAAANITCEKEENEKGLVVFSIRMPSGRDKRLIQLTNQSSMEEFLAIPFEKYVFLSDYEAICSYQ